MRGTRSGGEDGQGSERTDHAVERNRAARHRSPGFRGRTTSVMPEGLAWDAVSG
jgi:hypothetical protein